MFTQLKTLLIAIFVIVTRVLSVQVGFVMIIRMTRWAASQKNVIMYYISILREYYIYEVIYARVLVNELSSDFE